MKHDKIIELKGFNGNQFEIETRWLWCQILIRERYCDKCKNGERITFHQKDIPKLIKVLSKLNKELYKPK